MKSNPKQIKNYDGENGEIFFPLFEKEIQIYINGASLEYAEKCVAYLAELPDSVIEKLCAYSIRYCEDMRVYFREENINIPENISGRDVLEFISPNVLIVEAPQDETIAFHIEGYCDWEPEHGIEWVVRNGKVLYVGEFCDKSPWHGEDYFMNANWGYAVPDQTNSEKGE